MSEPGTRAPVGQVSGLRHAGITVRDLDVSLRFYCEGLGLRMTTRRESRSAHLSLVTGMPVSRLRKANLAIPGTDIDLEVLEWGGIERRSGAARACDWGSGHICLYVDNADAVLARLATAGFAQEAGRPYAFTDGPNTGAKALYVTDPDGFVIELYEPATSPVADGVA
jgi:lactoylglutathione lyase